MMTAAAGERAGPHPGLPRFLGLLMLGVLLLAIGISGLVIVSGVSVGTSQRPGTGAMPRIVLGLVIATAVLLLVQGTLSYRAIGRRWPLWAFVGIVLATMAMHWNAGATVIGLLTGSFGWLQVGFSPRFAQWFSPADLFAILLLQLAVALTFACYSRLAGLGMLLLGMLLSLVGTDVSTGTERLTFGLTDLLDGIGLLPLALGVVLVAEGLVAIASPALWLALARHGVGLSPAVPPTTGLAVALRVGGAVAIMIAVVMTHLANRSAFDVGLLALFGLIGLLAKLAGWNRWLLILGFLTAAILEVQLRRAMLLSRGDFGSFFTRPISGALLYAVIIILLSMMITGLVRFVQRMSQR